MALSVDEIVDRRALKRRVTFWRVIAILLLVLALIGLMAGSGIFNNYGKKKSPHIARVEITGVITNDRPMLELLDKLKEEDAVKGIILTISSPGGSTTGGEAIYEAVRDITAEKPVASSIGTLAASAGYMIASASEHIVARRSSIVGSIGVIFQYVDVSDLLEKIGVDVNEIKSAPLKAEPSPFHPASEEAKEMINQMIKDSYDWFVGIVAERRDMSRTRVLELADGSIFTGRQGLENGLIDEIGDEETARKWLVAEKGISDELEIHEWKPVRPTTSLFSNPAAGPSGLGKAALVWLARQFGIEREDAVDAIRESLPDRLFLDGLISIMQTETMKKR